MYRFASIPKLDAMTQLFVLEENVKPKHCQSVRPHMVAQSISDAAANSVHELMKKWVKFALNLNTTCSCSEEPAWQIF